MEPALAQASEVTRIERVVDTDDDLCYRLHYDGPVDELESWLERERRTAAARPFKLERTLDAGTIDLIFDGGFD